MHVLLSDYMTGSARPAPKRALGLPTFGGREEQAQRRPATGSTRDSRHTVVMPTSAPSLPERLFDATAQAKIWTSRVAMHLGPEARARFFKQLDRLHDIDEWTGQDSTLQLGSYQSFIRAVVYLKIDSRPCLALMPSGNLLALWEDAGDKLTIEFRPGDRARWLVSRMLEGQIERAAGESSLTRLRAVLAPYDANKWFHGG